MMLPPDTVINFMKGYPDWKLALCLFGAWLVAYLVIVKGVKSSGKASYFLALFPYVIMAVLLVRACTLQGADKGIIYFIKPQVGEIAKHKTCANGYQCYQLLFLLFSGNYYSVQRYEHFERK